MSHFIQLHLLTTYPPANLNRDDLGRPKTALMGGSLRLRISSQSLKRAWRVSETFQQALDQHLGKRTRRVSDLFYPRLQAAGINEKKALEWAGAMVKQFGTPDKQNALHTSQLVHVSPEEEHALQQLADAVAARNEGPTDDELASLRQRNHAADIALFGRMLADAPDANVEAAAQVAHAITVHPVTVEDDFFTAVDDLNDQAAGDAGAGHMGITEFGAGLFYLYLCIDRELLINNLQGDEALANRAIAALVKCTATVAPSGKQASFASRARANYMLCEVGDDQPRSLAAAFLKPIDERGNYLDQAIERLETLRDRFNAAYGDQHTTATSMNINAGTGSLAELIAHATATAHA